jgi:hypothetical protein
MTWIAGRRTQEPLAMDDVVSMVEQSEASQRASVVADNSAADRAQYYRQRAAEARAKAEAMTDYAARQTMLQVAAMWELMAKGAAKSAGDKP